MGRANIQKSSQKKLINSLPSIIIKQKLKQESQKQKEELSQQADLFQLQILSRLLTFIVQKYSGIIKTQIERGFRLIIEPQFFADSFFVKNPERVETILFIMSLCLLVYNIGQRELRKTLKRTNSQREKPVRKADKYSDIKMDISMVSIRTFFEN